MFRSNCQGLEVEKHFMITEKREYDVGKTFINSVAVLRSARCVMNLVSAAVNHFTPSTPI